MTSQAMDNEILLETRDLVKAFGAFRAVDGLNLQVRSGEMVGLVGPDGAGKTTTMRLLCGVLTPTSGHIRIAGYELPAQVEKAREHIGYLAQRFSLYPDMSVAENLEFFGEVFEIPRDIIKSRSESLLNFAGLAKFADRPAGALSGGMKQKLGLATALVHSPRVLLLDEPTGGVDPVARQEFWHLLIALLRSGSAVLVSTPYMDEAMRFNRVIFMNKGRVLESGTPRDLIARLQGRILELAAEPQVPAAHIAATVPGVEDVRTFGDRLHLRLHEGVVELPELLPALQSAGIEMIHIKAVVPTLEDVFIGLLEKDKHDYAPSV
jgi:ABC-2 type transport system ATP-binding protein